MRENTSCEDGRSRERTAFGERGTTADVAVADGEQRLNLALLSQSKSRCRLRQELLCFPTLGTVSQAGMPVTAVGIHPWHLWPTRKG